MKYSLLFFSLLSAGLVHAQPTLTAHSNPEANVRYGYVPATTIPAPGSGGANVTWNFSSLSAGTGYNVEYMPCPGGAHCATFPGSTFAASDGSGNYMHWIVDNNKIAVNGSYISTIPFIYSDPMEMLRYPFTYNDSFSDSFANTYLSGTFTYNRRGQITVTADGYGTLILPHATFTNVLRVKGEQHYYDEFSGTTPYLYTDVSYYWYAPNEHIYLAGYTSLSINGAPPTEQFHYTSRFPAGIAIQSQPISAVELFPNPATDLLRIRFVTSGATDVHIALTDMLGRPVQQTGFRTATAGLQEVALQTAGLSTGLYLVRIDAEGQSAIRKVELR